MKHHFYFHFLTLLLLSLLPASAHALINAIPAQGSTDLVRLEFRNREAVCTGFFVDPTTLITAAHCLYRSDGSLWSLQDLSIVGETQDTQAQARQIIPHPKYAAGKPAFDVGIIKTSPFTHFKGSFILGGKFPDIVGRAELYGAGRIDLGSGRYGLSRGTSYFIRLGSHLYSIGKSRNTESPGHAVSIAPNDSGGPVVDLSTGKVFALASRTTAQETWDTFLPAISISTWFGSKEILAFIQELTPRIQN